MIWLFSYVVLLTVEAKRNSQTRELKFCIMSHSSDDVSLEAKRNSQTRELKLLVIVALLLMISL